MFVLRELYELIKMLFTSHPSDFDEVKLTSFLNFPFKGYSMMWCGRLIVRMEDCGRFQKTAEKFPSWINHETIHLHQAQSPRFKNSWLRYYASYFWEWVKGNPLFNFHNGAYYTIPFEVEAYANENKQDYRTLCNVRKSKYSLKNRIKTYKENRRSWKNYIKEL